MTSWVPDLAAHDGPRYLALAEAIARDLEAGRLLPGTRLPTHRELADRLHVTVGTITRGYAVAAERGLVEATVGRGTFVRERRRAARMPEVQPAELIDLAMNRPTIGPQVDAFADTLRAIAEDESLGRLAGYSGSQGRSEHRESGARFLEALGVRVPADRVLITCGAQGALAAILASLTEPGDRIATECLGYPGIQAVAQSCRLRAHGVAIDDFGMIPESFEEVCRVERPRMLVTVPTHHNPTGSVLPLARREAIVAIARAYDVLILEDDVYGFLVDDRPPAIATLAPERTCYVACTSKPLMPGLRIGYVAAPAAYVDRIASSIRSAVWMAPPLMAEIASRWIDDGTAARLITYQRAEARARQALVKSHLGHLDRALHTQGFHRFIDLPEPWKVGAFIDLLRERGVGVAPTESFVVGHGSMPRAVRLCVSSPASRDELDRALGIVADVLAHAPPNAPSAF